MKVMKKTGKHYRMENGRLVCYNPGDEIEIPLRPCAFKDVMKKYKPGEVEPDTGKSKFKRKK